MAELTTAQVLDKIDALTEDRYMWEARGDQNSVAVIDRQIAELLGQ